MLNRSEKSIFLDALDRDTEPERQAFLAEACGGDRALRAAVDELLATHQRSGNVLDESDADSGSRRRHLDQAAAALGLDATLPFDSTHPSRPADRSGELVGNYRLLEKIGEGGFGEVYVADQQQPVRRRVALKLLKAGMDQREVLARFEVERQALAMMDHPHIARVFDAGTTAAGQPFFVMELVRGIPITEFGEQHHLAVRQRLELFVGVCQAVQHAHQKGIIHRDLKPSNVLVTLHDATPVAKVIDFGVAKALGDPLTARTIYTRFAQMIGTPMYMSPEQAEMNSLDVDTRSDIYSLGVMLYELLTGTTPFDQHRLQTAAFDELRRIIREEEPPRPSVRLTTLLPATTRAAGRHLESRARASMLRGDLDWIVMKALEKDRRRRYDTAADFARDVQRYLAQQPVLARPPSHWYRFTKFARRNKAAFTTVSLVLLALVLGIAVSTWQAVRATVASAEAEKLRGEAVEFASRLKQANVLLDSARANADEQRWSLALAQYTKATELQPNHYLTWSGRGSLYARVGAWRAAAADFAKALELGAPANNPGWWGVPQLCLYAGEDEAYALACQRQSEQLAHTEDPMQVVFAVRSLSLQPLPREEAQALARRMEKLLSEKRPPPQNRPPIDGPQRQPVIGGGAPGRPQGPPAGGADFPGPPMLPIELQWYACGLAHYRAGYSDRAIVRLRQVLDSQSPFPGTRTALPVLAMAYHQAGQKAQAAQALSDAEKFLDEGAEALLERNFQRRAPGGYPASRVPGRLPWFDFLECLLLYREAHEQIGGQRPAANSRIVGLEERALALLRGDE